MTDSHSATTNPADNGYTVIARRYRPQTFDELVGQEHVARALEQAIASGRVGHAYLFTGARGVGKTSAARILAKALNCKHGPTPTPCNQCDVCLGVSSGDDVDVLEIDGASNNGVDEIRELRQNVAVRPSRARFKIYIIDEVHMLSKSAFNALLKTLEEPPEHVKFIFATTEAHKIPITILSRCQRFDFAGINASSIQTRLTQIATAEGVQIEPAAVQILASRAAGSMRDSQSLLEQLLAVARERITADDVNQLLGIAAAERLSELVRHLVARDAAAALAALDATIADGVDVGLLLDQLVGYFRDVMTTAVGCNPDQMLYALPSQAAEVAEIGRELGLHTILAIGQILDQTAARLRLSIHGRTLVEMAVVRICNLGDLDELATLVAELRGGSIEGEPGRPQPRPDHPRRDAPAKKNSEPPATSSLVDALTKEESESKGITKAPAIEAKTWESPTKPWKAEPPAEPAPTPTEATSRQRVDPPHVVGASPTAKNGSPATASEQIEQPEDSVLAQFQRAMSDGPQAPSAAQPPRPSRREQIAAIAEQPLVRRAMELFDVAPNQLRYTPPEGET